MWITFFRMQNTPAANDNYRLDSVRSRTVLLVDASDAVRRRLTGLIEKLPRTAVIGQAADGLSAQRLFRRHHPDAVVLDLQLPGTGGLGLLEQFKREQPDCVVMVLTTYTMDAFRTFCAQLGADYFFDKSREFERVSEVLRDLAAPCNRRNSARLFSLNGGDYV